MRMMIGGHLLKIADGEIHYGELWKHKTYPLAGARAHVEAQGWRGQKRRVIVEGPGYMFTTGVEKYGATAYRAVTEINNAAAQLATAV